MLTCLGRKVEEDDTPEATEGDEGELESPSAKRSKKSSAVKSEPGHDEGSEEFF